MASIQGCGEGTRDSSTGTDDREKEEAITNMIDSLVAPE